MKNEPNEREIGAGYQKKWIEAQKEKQKVVRTSNLLKRIQ